MKLQVKHAGGELTVASQRELLKLFQSGLIAKDDLVKRVGQDGNDSWTPAGELPWIRGAHEIRRVDNRRLFWITVAMMVLGLVAVLYIQKHADAIARKTGALPPGAVQVSPRK